MTITRNLLTLVAAASQANAVYQGFNYGSTFTDGSAKQQSDFESDFKTAAGLQGTNGGFTSARFYTMIQGGSTDTPISGIPAAISTKTTMLFGLWASGGQADFNNEISALQSTIGQYCGQLDGLVAGISVGSEDLYRETPIGIASDAGPGASAETLAAYVSTVRDTIKGTCLSSVPVGHVDTWTAYVNSSNQPLIDAVDWLGMDSYPYYQNTQPNGIDDAKSLFEAALSNTQNAGGGKPVWITETGWPVSGPTSGQAVPSLQNARTYWEQVACSLLGQTNTWWFTLQDADPTTPSPSFGLIGSTLTETPVYDLSCQGVEVSTSSSAPASPSSSAAASSDPASSDPASSDPASSAPASSAPASSAPGSSPSSSPSSAMSSGAVSSGATTTGVVSSPSSANGSTMISMTSTPAVMPSTSTGSGSGSSSGSSPSSIPSTTAGNSGSPSGTKLNSIGAVAVALLAAAVL